MRRHPGSGWRGRCVLIAGGLMGYAAAPLPVIRAGELTTQPPVLSVPTPRRPAAPTPRPQPSRPATSPTPAAMQATPHADVLSSPKQLEQLGRLVEARRAYEAVLVKYPQHVECLHRLGVVCTRLNDFDAARSHYDRALAISPGNGPILIDAGFARYLAGDYRVAEYLLRKAVDAAPDDARAINNLAIVVGVTGRFDESLQLFQKSNPHAKAWTNLAYVYQLRHEPDQALICYQRARAIDTNVLIPEDLLPQTRPSESSLAQAELPPAPAKPQPGLAKLPSNPVVSTAPVPPTERSPLPPKPVVEPLHLPAVVHADATTPPQPKSATAPVKEMELAAPRTEQPRQPLVASTPKPESKVVASNSGLSAKRPLPDWAKEEPNLHTPATASIEIAPRNTAVSGASPSSEQPSVEQAPVIIATKAPELEDPFQLPLTKDPSPTPAVAETPVFAPELASEPAVIANKSGQSLHFQEPSGPVPDHAFDEADLAWLATQKSKLVKRANWEGTKGFCLVALLEERRLAEGLDEYSSEYQSQTYHFSSAEALEIFQAHPERYAPVAGGLDVVAVRTGSGVVAGSLDYATWYRNRLYLFSSPEHKEQFCANPQQFVKE